MCCLSNSTHVPTHSLIFYWQETNIAFPYSKLKDKHVSCSSPCLESCNAGVHTIGPASLDSKYYHTDVSILTGVSEKLGYRI